VNDAFPTIDLTLLSRHAVQVNRKTQTDDYINTSKNETEYGSLGFAAENRSIIERQHVSSSRGGRSF